MLPPIGIDTNGRDLKDERLLIVSHTPHYRSAKGIAGWGATVREIDVLAGMFLEVVHVAPIHETEAPESAISYSAENVIVRGVPPSGGVGLRSKLRIAGRYPQYASVLLRELPRADVVHVRCPANISILALLLLSVRRAPRSRWFKYAGNWDDYDDEPYSYRLQRAWLARGWSRGEVTVNGRWPAVPDHIHSFLNPCLTREELIRGSEIAQEKELDLPVRLLFVGRLESAKGVRRALKIVEGLKRKNVSARLDLVGDGPERSSFEEHAAALNIDDRVNFHGWQSRDRLNGFYEKAHFFLLPSTCSEGWPKVLSESMAYGVVPLASNISSIPQHLQRFGIGAALDPEREEAYEERIRAYLEEPGCWRKESALGVKAAAEFSYDSYLRAVRRLLLSAPSSSMGGRKK